MTENNSGTNFEVMDDSELAEKLRTFYGSLCTQDGQPYSKSSLRNIRAGLNRHLNAPPHFRIINIATDKLFQPANDIILGAIKELRLAGKDKSEHKPVIEKSDADKLYSSGVLSNENPTSLQDKVFFKTNIDILSFQSLRYCGKSKSNIS